MIWRVAIPKDRKKYSLPNYIIIDMMSLTSSRQFKMAPYT